VSGSGVPKSATDNSGRRRLKDSLELGRICYGENSKKSPGAQSEKKENGVGLRIRKKKVGTEPYWMGLGHLLPEARGWRAAKKQQREETG